MRRGKIKDEKNEQKTGNNQMGVLKHQGSLDTVQDILKILNGTKVEILAEMKAESDNQNYLR